MATSRMSNATRGWLCVLAGWAGPADGGAGLCGGALAAGPDSSHSHHIISMKLPPLVAFVDLGE